MKKTRTRIAGTIISVICIVSALATSTAVGAMTIGASKANTTSASSSTTEPPTIDREPGIYPIDGDHFLIVYKDHTYRLMHGEPPTTRPWTIA